jgi:DNA-3-methyladenine glycosylase II
VLYVKDLARHFEEGLIKPRRWTRLDDEAVIEDLVRVKGIGRWSAEMFLLFRMMRPNVLPVGDLGLQRAMEKLYNEGEPLTRDEMRVIGSPGIRGARSPRGTCGARSIRSRSLLR